MKERRERERKKDRCMGQVLAYLTHSMDVNLCFSASMSADLHKLWRSIYLFFCHFNW